MILVALLGVYICIALFRYLIYCSSENYAVARLKDFVFPDMSMGNLRDYCYDPYTMDFTLNPLNWGYWTKQAIIKFAVKKDVERRKREEKLKADLDKIIKDFNKIEGEESDTENKD